MNIDDYLEQLQKQLPLRGASINQNWCDDFKRLSIDNQIAYGHAIQNIGCEDIVLPVPQETVTIDQVKRIRAARLMLLQLYLAEKEPRWSSWLLDRLWEAVLSVPGGLHSDLYKALFDLFAEYEYELTEITGNFIREIVRSGHISTLKFRQVQVEENLACVTEGYLTKPQAYLCMYILFITNQAVPVRLSIAILKSLIGTPHWEEALGITEESLYSDEGKELLSTWIAEGIEPTYESELQRIVNS